MQKVLNKWINFFCKYKQKLSKSNVHIDQQKPDI